MLLASRLGQGAWAQSLEATFSAADLTQNPPWQGSLADFEASNGWLHLTARGPGQAWLATPLALQDSARWELTLWCGLAPSQANYARYVLAADGPGLGGAYTGWQLSVGQSGDRDGLDLYRVLQGRRRLVATFGEEQFARPFLTRIQISRGHDGTWRCWADTAATGYRLLGSVADTARLAGSYVGLEAGCTTSFLRYYWHWDDLRIWPGPAAPPNPDARLLRLACAGRRLYATPAPGVRPGNGPWAEVDGAPGALASPFARQPDGRYMARLRNATGVLGPDSAFRFTVRTTGWVDSLGGPVPPQTFACRCLPEAKRLALTEVKVATGNPQDQPPLPEYIELYNPAGHAVWLEAAELEDASLMRRTLPPDSLAAGAYRVYTSAAGMAALQAAGVVGNAAAALLPSLNDEGDRLRLRLFGQTADSLAYSPEAWPTLADLRALALERGPDCLPNGGWYPSRAALGGTPGQPSGYDWATDTTQAPKLSAAVWVPGLGLRLYLAPPLQPGADLAGTALAIDPPLPGGALMWADSQLVYAGSPAPDSGLAYRLMLSGAVGCGGASRPSALLMRQPVAADSGRLVLNEVLFDPRPGGLPFVEIHNPSARWVHLAGLGLASLRDPWADTAWLPTATPPLEPGGYRWLARERRNIAQAYPRAVPEAYLALRLPPLEAAGGRLALVNSTGAQIDALAYGPALHTPGLPTEGVSLERVSARQPTAAEGNWQSSGARPAATPGYRNSQSTEGSSPTGPGLQAEPSAFSPNADGWQDFTTLAASGLPNGTLGRLSIFDQAGNLIRRLAPQPALAGTFSAVWDGRTDAGTSAGPGLYIVLAEFFHPSQTLPQRKAVVGVQP